MKVPRPKIFCGKMFMGNNTICKYDTLNKINHHIWLDVIIIAVNFNTYESTPCPDHLWHFPKCKLGWNSFELLQKFFQTCQKLSRDSVHIIQTACDNIPLCVLCYKGWIMRWQFRIISQFVFPFQILEVLRFNKLFQLFFIKHQINNGWKPLWTWISWS